VLDKLAVSGLNQARHLFETIAGTPTARLPLPNEFAQLSAVTRKMYDISKSATAATPPVPTPTLGSDRTSLITKVFYQGVVLEL
jgi:hypothetical protein